MVEITALISVLTPAIPFLIGVAGKVGEGSAQAIGAEIWNQVKAKLGNKLAGHDLAKPAIEQLRQEPDNKNLNVIVQMALKDLLEKDRGLAAELDALLKSVPGNGNICIEQQIGTMTNSKAIANISDVKGNVNL
jgi:hypothetical protein